MTRVKDDYNDRLMDQFLAEKLGKSTPICHDRSCYARRSFPLSPTARHIT